MTENYGYRRDLKQMVYLTNLQVCLQKLALVYAGNTQLRKQACLKLYQPLKSKLLNRFPLS